MDATHYQVVWFGLLLLFFVAYSVLDGFDLGVGMLTFFTKSEEKRNLLFSALAPIWDGNELWLIIAGASLFAVFPQAYATALSGFYLPIFFIATGLMLRAAAFECRHLSRRAATKRAWECIFAIASFSVSLLLAVALGNIIAGLPLSASFVYGGSIVFLFRPYPLALAATGIALITLQGSLFAACKLPAPFSDELRANASKLWYVAVVTFTLHALIMPLQMPEARSRPLYWGASAVAALALVATKILTRPAGERGAFLASSTVIVSIWLMQAAALFPDLIRNTADASRSITIFNGGAEIGTLKILTGIAVPAALLYLALNWYLYATFKGKLPRNADLYGGGERSSAMPTEAENYPRAETAPRKPKTTAVRCKVCGYITDASKVGDRCPVCGVKASMFEPLTERFSDDRRRFLGLNIHPILAHFPQAFSVTILVLALAMPALPPAAGRVAGDALLALALALPFTLTMTFVSGLLDRRVRFKKFKAPYLRIKLWGGGSYLLLSALFAILALKSGGGLVSEAFRIAAAAGLVTFTTMLGHIGGRLTCCRVPG